MNTEYMVLFSEHHFAVFESIDRYQVEAFQGEEITLCMKESWEVTNYLIKKLGRNMLIGLNFCLPQSLGKVYTIKRKLM